MKRYLAKLFILPLFFVSLVSCNQSYISVHTDYLSRENLASFHTETPDPHLNYPSIGQRLILMWSVPPCYLYYNDLHLDLVMRFRNHKEVFQTIPVLKRRGTFVYPLINADYFNTKGILTYKVDLIGDGIVLEEWRHQIWTDLIELSQDIDHSSITSDELITPVNFDDFE